MKSTVRNRIAAALVLAPLALAALPAAAEYATVYVQPAAQSYPAWRHEGRRDHRPPQISDLSPSQGERIGERGWTRISARVTDFGSGIDARDISLRVDGRDVSYRTRFDGDEVRYRDDLAPGRHFAELVVRDRAGNATRQVWNFDVMPEHRGWQRYGYYDGNRY
jgi:hypothetical protein